MKLKRYFSPVGFLTIVNSIASAEFHVITVAVFGAGLLFAHTVSVLEHVTGSNRFCEDWMHAFVNGAEVGNPFLFRQILENFKLKVIVPVW